MISLPYNRRKVVGWISAALALVALVWYARQYRPARTAVAERVQALADREARVRRARAASVEVGQAGLDSLLERFRADSALLATRIPAAGAAAAVSAEVKDALALAERQTGARITGTEPLPPNPFGPFQTGGYVVRAVGRYSEVGALLARLGSLQRLTSVRNVRLHAIPDSLVRTAAPLSGSPQFGSPDSAGVAVSMAQAGETPFTATVMFNLHWYTLAPADSLAPSTDSMVGGGR